MLSSLVVFTLVVTLVVAWVLRLQCRTRCLPPGPRPLPLIGSLWTLKFKIHHETLARLAATYGNIYTVWLGKTPVVVLNGFQAVKEALIQHSEELSGRPASPLLRAVMGNKGILFSNGQIWRQQRRIGLMALRKLGLGTKGLEERIQDEAFHLLQFFKDEKGNPVDPACRLSHSMANVICAVVFGRRFAIEDAVFRQLMTTVELLMATRQQILSRVYDLFPWLMHHLPGSHRQMFQDWKVLRTFIKQEIANHQKNLTGEPRDLIDLYLNQISATAGDPNCTYNEENLIQVVADFFLAGTEAPTSTLHWALLYMVLYPDVQGKVQKELDAVVGPTNVIEYEDRKRLPYTNAVIYEIQRYANVIPIGPMRQCIKKITLQGIPIDKGTIILPDLTSVLKDPDQWETPREFNPGHFLDEEGLFVCKEAFIPFSAGHRVCLGEQLSRIELFIFFTNLLRTFTFQFPEGVTEASRECVYGTAIHPEPYKLCAISR